MVHVVPFLQAFGAGTAAIVSPVAGFHYKVHYSHIFIFLTPTTLIGHRVVPLHPQGKDYVVPLNKKDPKAKSGELTQRLWDSLTDIQYGRKAHKDWSVVVD